MADKIRVGIIGCGGIAEGAHIPGYQKLDDVELVAFCDVAEERAKRAAETFGAPGAKAYSDYEQMLAAGAVDAVSICTPNALHAPATIACLEAGVNVITEKPMADSTANAQKMLDAAKKSGKILTVGYQSRFRPQAQMLKSIIQKGDLGEIYYVRAHAVRRRGVPTWGVFLNKDLQGGGPLIDIGTHTLDLVLWLMDNHAPRRVVGSVYKKLADNYDYNSWGPWDPDKFEVEDSAFAHITFANGATVVLESSWLLNVRNHPNDVYCGTKGGAEMDGGKVILNGIEYGRPVVREVEAGGKVNPQDAKIADFIRAVREGGEPTVKAHEAFAVTQILEAIYRSGETGEAVYID